MSLLLAANAGGWWGGFVFRLVFLQVGKEVRPRHVMCRGVGEVGVHSREDDSVEEGRVYLLVLAVFILVSSGWATTQTRLCASLSQPVSFEVLSFARLPHIISWGRR